MGIVGEREGDGVERGWNIGILEMDWQERVHRRRVVIMSIFLVLGLLEL